eukprot:scpid43849/ scgid33602/ UBX domain-containing protein 11; Socius; UBX domain-containing protein 5
MNGHEANSKRRRDLSKRPDHVWDDLPVPSDPSTGHDLNATAEEVQSSIERELASNVGLRHAVLSQDSLAARNGTGPPAMEIPSMFIATRTSQSRDQYFLPMARTASKVSHSSQPGSNHGTSKPQTSTLPPLKKASGTSRASGRDQSQYTAERPSRQTSDRQRDYAMADVDGHSTLTAARSDGRALHGTRQAIQRTLTPIADRRPPSASRSHSSHNTDVLTSRSSSRNENRGNTNSESLVMDSTASGTRNKASSSVPPLGYTRPVNSNAKKVQENRPKSETGTYNPALLYPSKSTPVFNCYPNKSGKSSSVFDTPEYRALKLALEAKNKEVESLRVRCSQLNSQCNELIDINTHLVRSFGDARQGSGAGAEENRRVAGQDPDRVKGKSHNKAASIAILSDASINAGGDSLPSDDDDEIDAAEIGDAGATIFGDVWMPDLSYLPTSPQPLDVDFDGIVRAVWAINMQVPEKMIRRNFHENQAKFRAPDVVDMVIFKNGFILNNRFHAYESRGGSRIIKNLGEREWPEDLIAQYPAGGKIALSDQRDLLYDQYQTPVFPGVGIKTGKPDWVTGEQALSQNHGDRPEPERTLPRNPMQKMTVKDGQLHVENPTGFDKLRTMTVTAAARPISTEVISTDCTRSGLSSSKQCEPSKDFISLRIQSEDGMKMYLLKMLPTETIGRLRFYINMHRKNESITYRILSSVSRTYFSDDGATLVKCGLSPAAKLFLVPNAIALAVSRERK